MRGEMQAAVRFTAVADYPAANSTIIWFAMAHPPRSQGDRSHRLSVNRGDSDQLGKQRCRAADARAELPRIMGEQLKLQCRALPRCLYRLRHGSLLPTTDSMRWFGIRNTVVHRNRTAILGERLRVRGTLSDESTRAYLGLAAVAARAR